MSKFNFEIDTREYGYIDIQPKSYKFVAYCTSDACRLTHRTNESRTDVGVIKQVTKNVDVCPHCGYYLFWNKDVA